MIEVKHRFTGTVLETADLRGADLRGADLEGADLRGADLRGADLRGADLRGADLEGAYLANANLASADLRSANLASANLRGADLRGAYLANANLASADLASANLRGADLRGAYLPTGETWEVYCTEVVPELLAAGAHAVPADAWQCHTWDNCLIACAFGVRSLEQVPALYRPRAAQLIQFFDAGLLAHLAPKAAEQ